MAKKRNAQDADVALVKRMIAKAKADLTRQFTAMLNERGPLPKPDNVTTMPTEPVLRGGSEE